MNHSAKPPTLGTVLLTPLLLAFAATAQAAPRTSTNYAVPTDTTDSGGQSSTSTDYTNAASMGGMGGISTGVASAELVKAGYIGQLYEVTALQLAATPTTVDEGSTRQLSASQLLDDDTTIALAAGSITWSVQSGPLTGIDSNDLATASIVHEDTAATTQGNYAGDTGTLTLMVKNIDDDNFGSYALDGIDDHWQVLHFGEENPLAEPLVDADGDGQNNIFEFIAGLVPTDPTSFFDQRLEPVPGQPGQTRVIFSPRLADRSYTVRTSTTLLDPSWITLAGTTKADDGDERTVIDPDTTSGRKFYRVDITRP